MEPDVEQVINELDLHRTRFIVFCRSLTGEQLERPVPKSDWLVRDFIAHLATIDYSVTPMFERMQAGTPPAAQPGGEQRWDVDRWNQKRVEARRQSGVEELLIEAAEARVACRKALAAFTAEDLQSTMHFGGDSKRPGAEIRLIDYLRGWCKHDAMHAVDMMRALPENDTPLMQQWFDDPVVAAYQRAMNPD